MNTNKQTKWYAIRVPYGREMKLRELLSSHEVESFIPMQYKKVVIKEKTLNKLTPAIRNLIFVRSTSSFLNELKVQTETSIPFRYIMNKARDMPTIVPDKDMDNFIAVAGTLDDQLIYLTKIEPILKTGDWVRVIGGIFKGVEGQVIRIKKDRRIMVSVDNFIAIATAHINPLLLEKIDILN